MIIDAHLHCTGDETASDVLEALDDADIDIGVLIVPFLHNGYTLADPDAIRRANEHLSRLVRGHEDQLFGLAVVNPSLPGAADELRHAETARSRRHCASRSPASSSGAACIWPACSATSRPS